MINGFVVTLVIILGFVVIMWNGEQHFKREVFAALDCAAAHGMFRKMGGPLHGLTETQIAESMVLHCRYTGFTNAKELVPYVRDWLVAKAPELYQ